MTRAEALAESILQSRGLLTRYLAGFDDSNHTATVPGLPNHVAWILGHCALTMHRAAEKIDGRSRLDGSFIEGAASGDARRFGTESVAFGSDPGQGSAVFPPLARCIEIFSDAADRLAGALRHASEDSLDELVPFFGGASLPRWSVAPRIVFHNGTHCGQIADMRRVLGMKPIFA
jgi:hypothetical protein